MKKTRSIFYIMAFLVAGFQQPDAYAQWTTVGSAGFSTAQIAYTSLAFDGNSTPYVAYYDAPKSGRVTVRKYDGSNWVTVGSAGFSTGQAWYISLAFDGGGTPYVAYLDVGNGSKATVKKYNGSSWVTVGSAGFSAGQAGFTSLAFDGNDTPYVAYQDGVNGKATVKKYDGSNWVTVGSAGFSAGSAWYVSLAFDGAGSPYVAYGNGSNLNATVKKYNGSNWVNVGSAGFSAGRAEYISLAIDGSGAPYVAYTDWSNSGKATVMKYNGSSWVTLGSPGFSAGTAPYTSLAIDSNGAPYIAYTDHGNNGKATVMKYNGSSWVAIGGAGFSAGAALYNSLGIDGNGILHLAYRGDADNIGKATVMKYNQPCNITTSTSVSNVLCNGGATGSVDLTVNNATAPVIYTWSNNLTTEDLNGISAGTYIVTITDANGCTAADTTTVTEPAALIASATGTNNICNGGTAGAADLTVNGGTAGYSYLWSNGTTTEDISGLTAGSYTVVVTDNNGCTANTGYTVTEPDALIASATGTNNICNGGTTGAVDLTVTDGTAGYSYLWSNGATTEDISGLTAGSYTVVVTDNNGCTANVGYTVTEPAAITAGISVSPSPTVPGHAANTIYLGYGAQSVTLSVSANGGTPGYTYSWSNGSTASSNTVSPASTTTYTVTITDANGCTHNVSQTIKVIDVRCGNNNNKVIVCHIPPGNPANQHNICVSPNAVPSHLAHGCYVGPCGSAKGGRAGNDEDQINSGFQEIIEEGRWNTYPNPNNGTFVLELASKDAARIFITNMKGQVVYKNEVNNTAKLSIELGNVAKGLYLLQVVSGLDTYQTKLTIQ